MGRRPRHPEATWRARGDAFDELVLEGWLHVEAMDTGLWFVEIAGTKLYVGTNPDGTAKYVNHFEGPPISGKRDQ